MTEELKSLIEKIQVEGVQVAQDKARAIEDEARQKAGAIIEKAKKEAEKMLAEAQERIQKLEEASRLVLKQAARDTTIALKKEINNLLDKIIKSTIAQALTVQELSKIITTLIKDYAAKHKEGIELTLNKEDREKIEKGFLNALKEELRKGIVLKSSDEISAGFLISFDAGKSHFDFTDKALTDYLGIYLKPKLAELFK